MAVEKTIISDAKSESGVVGLTRKKPALVRWALTHHLLGQYAASMRKRSGPCEKDGSPHYECTESTLKRDEADVTKLVIHFSSNMTNPFALLDHEELPLIHLSTDLHASKDVQKSLLEPVDRGNKKVSNFVESTLSVGGSRSFYDPIKRSNLLTFNSMKKATKVNILGKVQHVKVSAETVFRRALSLSKVRENVNMEVILCKPLIAVPTALFNEEGCTMRKTQKADLMHRLEDMCKKQTLFPENTTPSDTVFIRDAMPEFHKVQVKSFSNFDAMAADYLKDICLTLKYADLVIDVYDQYRPSSVKTQERIRRGEMILIQNSTRFSLVVQSLL